MIHADWNYGMCPHYESDNDGDVEIVYSWPHRNTKNYYEDRLFIWSYADGNYANILSRTLANTGIASQLALADIDSDGELEVILGASYNNDSGYQSTYSYVKAFNYDGSLFLTTAFTDSGSYFMSSPVVGDVDGDGEQEIILFDGVNIFARDYLKVYVYNSDGTINSAFKMPGNTSLNNEWSAPAIADLDNDGYVKLIALHPNTGMIAVWNMQGSYDQSLVDWPQFQHDPLHTGLYHNSVQIPITGTLTATVTVTPELQYCNAQCLKVM